MKISVLLLVLLLTICTFVQGVDPITSSQLLQLVDLQWLDPQHIAALAYLSGSNDISLLISSDEGSTFQKITLPNNNANNEIISLNPSPVQPQWNFSIFQKNGFCAHDSIFDQNRAKHDGILFYFSNNIQIYIEGETTNWVSKDSGATWNTLTFITKPENILWHPKKEEWGLGYSFANNGQVNLFMTQDFGSTWFLIASDLIQYGWGDAGEGDIQHERVYVINFNETGVNFQYSDDMGKTWVTEISGSSQFLFYGNRIFATVEEQTTGLVLVKVSDGFGKQYRNYMTTQFPFGDELAEQNGYFLLDGSTGAIYLGLARQGQQWGHVYQSDSTGSRYQAALQHVNRFNAFDFDVERSIEGFFIGNILTNWEQPQAQEVVKTKFTFDNSVSWKSLKPPTFDSKHQPTCQHISGECYLHLHSWGVRFQGDFQLFGPFWSARNAVGLVIGTGNVGESLSFDPSLTNTYLTRDGGLTWIELMKGNTIYDFGDHGGIILMAPLLENTTKLYYTLDEGLTVNSFTISTTPISVYSILSEPTLNSRVFLVEAIRASDNEGIVFSVDFKNILSNPCQASDYEEWSPDSGERTDGERCVLGHTITYLRKKQSSLCYNTETEVAKSVTNCVCTELDWECDFGFERLANGSCGITNAYVVPNPPADCPPGTSYYVTRGYRKAPGNTCENGVDHTAQGPFDCPGSHTSSSLAAWAIVLIVFAVLCTCVTASALFLRFAPWAKSVPYNPFHRLHSDPNDLLQDEVLYREPESDIVDLDSKDDKNNFNPDL